RASHADHLRSGSLDDDMTIAVAAQAWSSLQVEHVASSVRVERAVRQACGSSARCAKRAGRARVACETIVERWRQPSSGRRVERVPQLAGRPLLAIAEPRRRSRGAAEPTNEWRPVVSRSDVRRYEHSAAAK